MVTILIPETADQLRQRDPVLHKSVHQYDRQHYDSHNYGSVILLDGKEVAHLIMCVHCRAHFLNVKIPGKPRGFCMNCNGPVCPNPNCDVCVPFEQWLENVEKGLPPGHKPIKAAVHGEVPTTLLKKK